MPVLPTAPDRERGETAFIKTAHTTRHSRTGVCVDELLHPPPLFPDKSPFHILFSPPFLPLAPPFLLAKECSPAGGGEAVQSVWLPCPSVCVDGRQQEAQRKRQGFLFCTYSRGPPPLSCSLLSLRAELNGQSFFATLKLRKFFLPCTASALSLELRSRIFFYLFFTKATNIPYEIATAVPRENHPATII